MVLIMVLCGTGGIFLQKFFQAIQNVKGLRKLTELINDIERISQWYVVEVINYILRFSKENQLCLIIVFSSFIFSKNLKELLFSLTYI